MGWGLIKKARQPGSAHSSWLPHLIVPKGLRGVWMHRDHCRVTVTGNVTSPCAKTRAHLNRGCAVVHNSV